MASRPAFFPLLSVVGVDDTRTFEFAWSPGLSFTQKQRNVSALHASIWRNFPVCKILEVSSKSTEQLGVCLSAFNLSFPTDDDFMPVETAFQASKVFEKAGPFPELYGKDPRLVRDYVRNLNAGKLIGFEIDGDRWELYPTRVFYDWFYIRALSRNPKLSAAACKYDCFTDIEFNPQKSLNCQAYAVALYLSMRHVGVLDEALKNKESFLHFHPADVVVVGKGTNSHVATTLTQPTFGF